jgi:deoxycytidylate deaminase
MKDKKIPLVKVIEQTPGYSETVYLDTRNTREVKDKLVSLQQLSNSRRAKVACIMEVMDHHLEVCFRFNGVNHVFQHIYKPEQNPLERPDGVSQDCVIHAEEDCVRQFVKSNKNSMFPKGYTTRFTVSHAPCMNCCKLMVMVNVTEVRYVDKYRESFDTPVCEGHVTPREYLELHGVTVSKI